MLITSCKIKIFYSIILISIIIFYIQPSYSSENSEWVEYYLNPCYRKELYLRSVKDTIKKENGDGKWTESNKISNISILEEYKQVQPLSPIGDNHEKVMGPELKLGLLSDQQVKISKPHDKWPQRVFGLIRMNFSDDISSKNPSDWGDGTGALIGPCHVLTAAHNLFDQKRERWATDISFYPSLQDGETCLGEAKGAVLLVHKKWIVESNKGKNFNFKMTNGSAASLKQEDLAIYVRENSLYCKIKDKQEMEIKLASNVISGGISEEIFNRVKEAVMNSGTINQHDQVALLDFLSLCQYTTNKREFDIGMIILAANTTHSVKEKWMGYKVGWMGIFNGNDNLYRNKKFTLSGYPSNLQSKAKPIQMVEMSQEDAKVPLKFFPGYIQYWIDTYEGSSGSPVWGDFIGKDQHIVAVHTYGEIVQEKTNSQNISYQISKNSYNEAVRITAEKFNLIVRGIENFWPIENNLEHALNLLNSKTLYLKLQHDQDLKIQEERFFDSVRKNDFLKVLDLSDNHFSVYTPVSCIYLHEGLKILILQNIEADDAKIGSLAAFLTLSRAELSFLDLSNNKKIKDIKPLMWLVNEKKSLIRLDLENTEILELSELNKTLDENFKYKLRTDLRSIENLGIQYLLKALKSVVPTEQEHEEVVVDQETGLGFLVAITKAKVCNLSRKLRVVGWEELLSIIILKTSSLEALNLSDNEIKDDQASRIFTTIRFNKSLTLLNLRNNAFTDKGVEEITESLCGNHTLEKLVVEGNTNLTYYGKNKVIRRVQCLKQNIGSTNQYLSYIVAEELQNSYEEKVRNEEEKKTLPQSTNFSTISSIAKKNDASKSELGQARKCHEKANELIKKGMLEKADKKLRKAEKHYKESFKINGNENAARALVNMFYKQERYEEAKQYCLLIEILEDVLLEKIEKKLEKMRNGKK